MKSWARTANNKYAWVTLASFLLVPEAFSATVYNLNIDSAFQTDVLNNFTTPLHGTLAIQLNDNGQLQYLNQSVFTQNGTLDWLYNNYSCGYLSTSVGCKTLGYRAATSDYYFSAYGPGYETAVSWTESVTFDGLTFISNVWANGGWDQPYSYYIHANVESSYTVPLPISFWLFTSGLFWLFGVVKRKRNNA
jgi:hypothetical protein